MKAALWAVPAVAAVGLAMFGLSRVPFERIGAPPPKPLPVPTAANLSPPARQPTSKALDIPGKCKAFIASLMGRPAETMSYQYPSDGDMSMVFVSYMRDDGTVWKYQCKTDGQTIVWRGVDVDGPGSGPGRWREEDRVPLSSL
jgi:hypothetical protein